MSVIERYYQVEAKDSAISFFRSNRISNGLIILSTGSGKSVVIANIIKDLSEPTLIFQPSKEILLQNYAKYIGYGYRASIYSESGGMKHVDDVTFATIGSVIRKKHLFRRFKRIIIDECHNVSPDDGMYLEFIESQPEAKVLGLTATPYRLTNDEGGAMLKFLTNSRPRVFNDVLYYIQNDVLFNAGFLAPLEYFSFDVIDRGRLDMNASGTDFTVESLKRHYESINMPKQIARYTNYALSKRANCLVFCSLIEEARQVARMVPGSVVITGDTEDSIRSRALKEMNNGSLRCVINVGVWTTGVDIPSLESCVIGKSTMSLAQYYQIIGRVMRPHTYADGTKKIGWVFDLGGNIKLFGKIETMKIEQDRQGQYCIRNNGRRLTDVAFSKN